MTPRIAVSVALVTRNRPRSLERCLESWRRQTVAPDEIVVSDDSDDDTAAESEEIARRYGCRYTRGPRRGLYANRNHASLECRGTHIVSADDDHTHPADYVAVIRDLITSDPPRSGFSPSACRAIPSSPLTCPPELHRSGFGSAPADPSRCAAIADGASVYPRRDLRVGAALRRNLSLSAACGTSGENCSRDHGWRISFSDRTFVWHHFWPDDATPDEGRLEDRAAAAAATARDDVRAVCRRAVARSIARCRSAGPRAYALRRLLIPDSIVHFRVRTRLSPAGVIRALWLAVRARTRVSVRVNAVERHLASARRSAQVLLARHPLVYERLLRAAGRGSLEKRTFLRLLRLGDVVVDVGANAGYFTLLFSDIVGASGEVHAFEPIAPTFDRLSSMMDEAGGSITSP